MSEILYIKNSFGSQRRIQIQSKDASSPSMVVESQARWHIVSLKVRFRIQKKKTNWDN